MTEYREGLRAQPRAIVSAAAAHRSTALVATLVAAFGAGAFVFFRSGPAAAGIVLLVSVVAALLMRTAAAIERAEAGARAQRLELETERERHATTAGDLRVVIRKLNHAQRENAELAAAVEHVPVAVAVLDAAWRVEFVNPEFERATGYARDFVLGRPIEVFSDLAGADGTRESVESHLAALGTWVGRLRTRRRDGSAFDTEATVTSVPDLDPPRYVAVLRQAASETRLEPGSRRSQKAGASRAAGHPVALPIGPIVHEAVQRLRPELPAAIRLDVRVEDEAGAVPADADEVRQIVADLATSAVRAMRRTGGVLAITVQDLPPERAPADAGLRRASRYTRITVGDTGPGMDQATLARVFDPSAPQVPGEEPAEELARVQGVVTALGGSIAVSSWPGAGTIVRVDLPCEDIAAAGESGRAADVA